MEKIKTTKNDSDRGGGVISMRFFCFFLFSIFSFKKVIVLPHPLKCLGNDNIFQNIIGFNNLSFTSFAYLEK